MTDQTFAEYLPHIRRRWLEEQDGWAKRRARAWEAARRAADVLRTQFAADAVIAFGSLAGEGQFDEESDIDLAVSGIAPKKFFRAWADAGNVTGEFDLQIVDLAECSPALLEKISTDGKPL
jgi:uncharacterized protein